MSKSASHDREPPRIDEVRSLYEKLPEVYAAQDRWHAVSHRWIERFIEAELLTASKTPGWSCLNLGSGGESYALPETSLLHVDLHRNGFKDDQKVVVADIQNLPPLGGMFGACICVGSVINHCDAASVIVGIKNELARGGTLILEFETSASLELLFSGHFNRSATVIDTFYHDRTIRLWAYSEGYVQTLLTANNFVIVGRSTCHHFSPLAYLLSRNSSFAARFHVFDSIARRLFWLSHCASNVIYACRRVS